MNRLIREAQRAEEYRRRVLEITKEMATANAARIPALRLKLDCYRALLDDVKVLNDPVSGITTLVAPTRH